MQNRKKAIKANQKPKAKKLQISSKKGKIILDPDFVEEYLRKQNEKNATVIDVDESDSDVEYVKTESASPKTKKIAKINARIIDLEKQLAAGSKAKIKRIEKTSAPKDDDLLASTFDETCESMSSVEPRSSTSFESTSSESINSEPANNSLLDWGIDTVQVNHMIDEWNANGQLPEIAAEVMEFIKQQEQQ